jgi:hypothetical protein
MFTAIPRPLFHILPITIRLSMKKNLFEVPSLAGKTHSDSKAVGSATRRSFIKALGTGAATVGISACGGVKSHFFSTGNPVPPAPVTTSAAPITTTPATNTAPSPVVASPVPPGSPAATFRLESAIGGENLPFTIGHAFKKGQVPSGTNIVGSIPEMQVAGKNWWADGSLKFALISGHASITRSTPLTVTLGVGSAATPGKSLTTADLVATGVEASIDAQALGLARWSGGDWNAPFLTWVGGAQMSSWVYRQPIGSDAHLVAWLEVRLYASGAVEVLPWIENGYVLVPGPTSKNAVFTFNLGKSQRFSKSIDLPNHTRTVLISGSALSHWLGTDPQVTPGHDPAYLQATRLTPAYRVTTPGEALLAGLPQTFEPLQQGSYPGAMGTAGYDPSIGILPQWDALYLTSRDVRAYRGVITNAYSAGRYGIHFRDEKSNRPILFSQYPNLVLSGNGENLQGTSASSKETYTPAATGTLPPVWNSTHHPSVGYLAYLVTGRFYFMEEVQFAATIHFLKNNDVAREFTKGVLRTNAGANTTRGMAWSLRTLAQAACITPDDDTALRRDFLTSVEGNVDYHHRIYVAQPNNNYGFFAPYTDYTGVGDNITFVATWQQDFVTAAVGYMLDLEPRISAAGADKLAALFRWKAASIVGRHGRTGVPTEYPYTQAATYTIAIAPSDTPDFMGGTGPWYPDWGAVYTATKGNGAKNDVISTDLSGGSFPEATSYWGNSAPALAYAVEHGAPGAKEAYARLTSASNWKLLETDFDNAPEWAIMPRNAGQA